MSKSYKPKDGNYIDSTGIVHGQISLKNIINGEDITFTPTTGVSVYQLSAKRYGNVCVMNGRLNTTASKSAYSTLGTFSSNAKPKTNVFFVGYTTQSGGNWKGALNQNCELLTTVSINSSVEVYFTLCYVGN